MTDDIRLNQINKIYHQALARATDAGWYTYVMLEVQRDLQFVREHASDRVRDIYENANRWLEENASRAEVDGARSLLNFGHPMVTGIPTFFESYTLLERKFCGV